MPKYQNPPQGGEKYLCLTIFITMMLSVVSAVAIIYSIVIVYVPSKMCWNPTSKAPPCAQPSSWRKIWWALRPAMDGPLALSGVYQK